MPEALPSAESGPNSEGNPLGRKPVQLNGAVCDKARALADGDVLEVPGLRIEVRKSTHSLTVLRGPVVLRVFLVGLGARDSTPEGEFRIARKITRPDWYHRGRSVPAGDPANPLGRLWLGLSSRGAPTPYGIHPSGDPAAVGANQGRGCILMRPEDAETVFRLCPVDTPVRISP